MPISPPYACPIGRRRCSRAAFAPSTRRADLAKKCAQRIASRENVPTRRVDLLIAGDGPERIHGEWWRRVGEMWAVRDYFRVEAESGERFWLFRRGDAVTDNSGDLSWYMHGVFG